MAERLALPTSDHGVAGSNPAGGEILPEPKRRFIACSHFHRLEMTEILLKGRKTLTHPSIHPACGIKRRIITGNHFIFACSLFRDFGSTTGARGLRFATHVVFLYKFYKCKCFGKKCKIREGSNSRILANIKFLRISEFIVIQR